MSEGIYEWWQFEGERSSEGGEGMLGGGGKGEGSARVTGAILITHGEVPKPPALAMVYRTGTL